MIVNLMTDTPDDQKYLNKKKSLKFRKYFNLREWLIRNSKNDHEMMFLFTDGFFVSSYDGFITISSGTSYEKSSSK